MNQINSRVCIRRVSNSRYYVAEMFIDKKYMDVEIIEDYTPIRLAMSWMLALKTENKQIFSGRRCSSSS